MSRGSRLHFEPRRAAGKGAEHETGGLFKIAEKLLECRV
jgi:hypothetical protein